MAAGRKRVATLVAVGTCLGLHVATGHPQPVRASVPTPGIITTYAGGGLGSGPAATIPQIPMSLAITGAQLYVSDYRNMVRVLDTGTGWMTPVAGNRTYGTSGDGGPATSAAISRPSGVAVDSVGNLYITTFDGRVRKVTPAGIITTFAGGGSGPLGDGGPAASAYLQDPSGVATDAAGNVFIADTSNHRIRKVAPTGIITTVAGTGYGGWFGDDGGPSTAARLNAPRDVWADAVGNIWIADTANGRIRMVDHTTGVITTVAGGGATACSEPCPATSQQLSYPVGIWVNSAGDYWIAESGGHRVRRVDHVTGFITTVAGTGVNGFGGDGGAATSALMESPNKAIADSSGNLYITDAGFNQRLRKVDFASGKISTVAGGIGCGGFGDGGQATLAMMCNPVAAAVDGAGNLSIADGDRVRQVSGYSGVITTVAGGGGSGGCVEPCPATSAILKYPTGLAATASGDLYIADLYTVHKVSGGTMTLFAGNGTAGYSGDNGPATSAQLSNPLSVAVDSAGNVFIGDYANNAIRRVDHTTGVITTVTTIPHPTSIAVDSAGNLYFVSRPNASTGQGVYEWVQSSGVVVYLSSYWTENVAVGPGDQVVFSVPSSNYVTGSATVFMLTKNGPLALAGNGSGGFSGDGGLATSAQLYDPFALAFDSAGDFFITSRNDGHVRRVQAYTAPTPPRAVQAVPGDNSANVQWVAPASNGGLPVVGYTVTPYAGATAGTPIVISGPSTSYAMTGISNSTSYTFTVRATNAWGTSGDSPPSNAVTPGRLFPGYITTQAGAVGAGAATSIGQQPVALAIGPVDGVNTHLYVGDWANSVVRDVVVNSGQEGVLAGVAAQGYAGDGGPATGALLDAAGAVAYCDGGNTFIADTYNYVIRKVDARGVITTVAGTGFRGFNGDGVGTSVKIGAVFGLTCQGDSVLISDTSNGRIRQLYTNGQLITRWYGFRAPTGIVVDPQGVIYVADTARGLVWRLAYTEPRITLMAGGGAGCPPDPQQCFGYDSKLNSPIGLALDSQGRLYIADTLNHKIRMVIGGFIYPVAGDGIAGFKGDGGQAQNAELNEPNDIVLSPGGDALFVADSGNRRIRKIANPATNPQISTIAGNGTNGWSGDGGPATSAQLANPYAVAVDAAGNEYIADNQNDLIRKIDVNGAITTVAGNRTNGFSGDGGPATGAALNDPRGVAVDAGGSIYISDMGNQRIRKVDSAGVITTIAGTGVAGFSGDSGAATAAMINAPRGLAVDASGAVYFADTANHRVRKVAGGIISTVAGTGSAGFAGDGSQATAAQLSRPRGLAINAAGDVFISDSGNNRIRLVKNATGIITTFAGNGVAGSLGDGYAATSANLNLPFGLALDGTGNLYIADQMNHRVRLVDTNGIISTAIGSCSLNAGFSGDWGPASIAQVDYPYGVAVGPNGNVLVADTASNRIRRAIGLVGMRGATCQAPASPEAGPRDASASGGAGSPPRTPEMGGSSRLPRTGVSAATTGPVLPPSRVGAQPPPAASKPPTAQAPAAVPTSNAGPVAPPAATPEGGSSLTKPSRTAVDAAVSPRILNEPPLYVALLVPIALLPLAALWWHRRRRHDRRLTTGERQPRR
jgi:sugar lactone lactonase YvrE